MQQDAEQDQVYGMTASVTPSDRLQVLQAVQEFAQASRATMQKLADAAELVELPALAETALVGCLSFT